MTKQEDIQQVIDEVLSDALILEQFTHENCPPNADNADCKLKPEVKHRRCVECWQEFVDKLNLTLRQKLHSKGVVITNDDIENDILASMSVYPKSVEGGQFSWVNCSNIKASDNTSSITCCMSSCLVIYSPLRF